DRTAEDSGWEQNRRARPLRQLDQEPVQPGTEQGSLLERAELGRDVHPLVRIHGGQQSPDEIGRRAEREQAIKAGNFGPVVLISMMSLCGRRITVIETKWSRSYSAS